MFTAQEILVGNADYPTEPIAENARRFRQLGLGYANLGALLMALGLPYDSDEGRALAAAVTALMTGHAYATSARIAARMGPFAGYAENAEHMLRVLGMHREAAARIDEELVPADLLSAAQQSWDDACELAEVHGVRNSQASVLAPTGTIGLMMDCDTTGIEPDLGLCKVKKLVGGGTMTIVNQTVPRALRRLGYLENEIDEIVAYIDEHKTILGAPHLLAEHVAGVRLLDGRQRHPLLGPREDDGRRPAVHLGRHLQDGQHARGGDRRGGRAAPHRGLAARPQGGRHLPRQLQGRPAAGHGQEGVGRGDRRSAAPAGRGRRADRRARSSTSRSAGSCPARRTSRTFEFRVADCKGFVTVGEYEDGRPGEIFVRVSKQGSTLAGIMDAFAISISYGLQYGVPLRSFVEAFTGMRFEPAGMTDDPDIRIATSLMDYLFRRLAIEYLSLRGAGRAQHLHHGRADPADAARGRGDGHRDPPGLRHAGRPAVGRVGLAARRPALAARHAAEPARRSQRSHDRVSDAPMCMQCGVQMQRAGSCHACPSCGTTSGCS